MPIVQVPTDATRHERLSLYYTIEYATNLRVKVWEHSSETWRPLPRENEPSLGDVLAFAWDGLPDIHHVKLPWTASARIKHATRGTREVAEAVGVLALLPVAVVAIPVLAVASLFWKKKPKA